MAARLPRSKIVADILVNCRLLKELYAGEEQQPAKTACNGDKLNGPGNRPFEMGLVKMLMDISRWHRVPFLGSRLGQNMLNVTLSTLTLLSTIVRPTLKQSERLRIFPVHNHS
jgi:hypothetical protein